jgi:hypothetical protein
MARIGEVRQAAAAPTGACRDCEQTSYRPTV